MLRQYLKNFNNLHFWAVVMFFVICIVLHYPQQILSIDSPSLFSFMGLNRHAVERILLLLPVGYTSFVFGTGAGFISLAVASVIMLPRVFFISEYFPDALLETIGVVFVGVLTNLWFDGYKKEKKQRQQMLSELETANQQLKSLFHETKRDEKRYREIFESAHDAIWIHDLDGNLTAVNKASEDLTGYSSKELLNMNVKSFLTEESLVLARQIRHKLLSGEIIEQPYDQRIIKRNGADVLLKLTTSIVREDGESVGFQHIARDVTREKEMQDKLGTAYQEFNESHQRLKESQDQLVQAEKLMSLGQLATSIPAIMEVNLNDIVNRAFDLTAHSAELQHIKVTKELELSLPGLMADADQLQQVFTNLIFNAIQAMPDGGRLTLSTSISNGQFKIDIQDTSYGISPARMHKLFTPFFTKKHETKGVRLGLAVSYGIIQRHQGRIEMQSQEGEGTTFTVFLPLNNEEYKESS